MIKLTDLITEGLEDYKLYVDLDGVLVDFDKGYEKLTGITTTEAEKTLTPKEFWEPITVAGASYWANLEWMPDGKRLWEYAKQYKTEILTSPSRDKTSIYGKAAWCKRNIPGYKVNYSFHKQKFATPKSILIDDRPKNIDKWKAAGGIGILHKSTLDTIKQLKKLDI